MKGERRLTVTNTGRRETARSALLLLDMVRALAATTAQSVRLIIPLTESGGTLSYNHFLCCLRSTEMHRCLLCGRMPLLNDDGTLKHTSQPQAHATEWMLVAAACEGRVALQQSGGRLQRGERLLAAALAAGRDDRG